MSKKNAKKIRMLVTYGLKVVLRQLEARNAQSADPRCIGILCLCAVIAFIQRGVMIMSKFNKPTRDEIKKRADYKCEICGNKTKTGECHHIVPRFVGGNSLISNGAYLCTECHRKLHRKLRKVLAKFIREKSDLWKRRNGGE